MENLLKDLKVAVVVTDGFEEPELTSPVKALKDAGATVHIVAPKSGKVQAFRHHDKSIQVDVDRNLDEVLPGDYDALMLPGGVINADALRIIPKAQQLVRAIVDAGKPIAVICHGSWVLVSAGVLKGRKLTSWPTLADDLKNAGATWEDREVLVDGKFVSSRKPDDLPAFNREMIELFSKSRSSEKAA